MLSKQLLCHVIGAGIVFRLYYFVQPTKTSRLFARKHSLNSPRPLSIKIRTATTRIWHGPRLVQPSQQLRHALGVKVVQFLRSSSKGSAARDAVMLLLRAEFAHLIAIHVFGTAIDAVEVG